jgi:hypothetical protein
MTPTLRIAVWAIAKISLLVPVAAWAGCGISSLSCNEWHVIARDMGSFVAPKDVEVGAEFSRLSVLIDLDVSRVDHINGAAISSLEFYRPPAADYCQRTAFRLAPVARSFVMRIRAQAAASGTTQPTRAKPRCRMLPDPAANLMQPNGSPLRFHKRWLTT